MPAFGTSERLLRAKMHERHMAVPPLWERLSSTDPDRARQLYLEKQLTVASRLSTAMASSVDVDEVVRSVVEELHQTFGVFLAMIQRLDDDGYLRAVASAGPMAEVLHAFVLLEQPVAAGINGRVARTAMSALVPDTRLEPDYAIRDPATDPLSEIAVPIFVDGHVWGVLNIEELRAHSFDRGDLTLLELIAAELGGALRRCQLYGELEQAFTTTLTVLCSAVEANDAYTAAHEQDVATLAIAVATELQLEPVVQRAVQYAALTHDLGKIAVPSQILNKQGPLDPAEWEIMRGHAAIGSELLRQIPFFADVHPMVRSHHERWDGGGYPDGLAGEQIPIGARILTACDAYNAMITRRPYRADLDHSIAIAELRANAGSQFDPQVVEALLRVLGAS
ncbi:MAG TPA: HD-GYP domain-containing protein [Solirubrobacteraceae bacterium]|nr:HD-GYP domain-containing protein [Solirubrobacteraceae bacterium]